MVPGPTQPGSRRTTGTGRRFSDSLSTVGLRRPGSEHCHQQHHQGESTDENAEQVRPMGRLIDLVEMLVPDPYLGDLLVAHLSAFRLSSASILASMRRNEASVS